MVAGASTPIAASEHVAQHVVQPGLAQVEVHEAGAGDLHPVHVRRRRRLEPRDEVAGKLPRDASGRLGGGHRDVRRPVAVLAPARPLEVDLRRRLDPDVDEGSTQRAGEGVSDHGPSPIGTAAR
jgi:hypothetical protein